MGRPKRRYVLYEHLKFLTKVTPEECSVEQNEYMNDSNEDVPYMKQEEGQIPQTPEVQEDNYVPKKRSKRSDLDDSKSNYCVIETSYSQKKKSKHSDFDDLVSNDYCVSESSYGTKKKSKRFSVDRNDCQDSSYSKKKSKRESSKAVNDDDINNDIDFVEIDEADNPRVMNEDEAFFASLLPTIVKYNEDERLEFRIEVLGVMKKIKDKRKWSDD